MKSLDISGSEKNNLDNLKSNTYPWLIISLCSGFLFYKFILQISPSVMTTDFMLRYHLNATSLGNLAATYFYSYLIGQIVAGPLLDRYSTRTITAAAIAFCAAGSLVFATTNHFWVASLARMCIGFGVSFATISYMKLSSIWFQPKQMPIVDGLLATAAMGGALFAQVPLASLVKKIGWQWSMSTIGLAGFLLAVLFFMIVREPAPSSSSVQREEQGLQYFKNFYLLLCQKENALLAFYSGLAFTPVAVLGGLWANPFFTKTYHLSLTQAASMTSFIFLGLGLGGPFFGYLSQKKGCFNVMVVGGLLELLSLMIMIYAHDLPLPVLGTLLFLFGFSTSSFMLCFTLGKKWNLLCYSATIISIINSGDALLGSFTEPLIGKILDKTWNGKLLQGVPDFTAENFRMAFLILPLYVVLALGCLWWLRKSAAEKQ